MPETMIFSPIQECKCSDCGELFTSTILLKRHRRTHFVFKCVLCSKTFSKNWILKAHYMIHTGEKPFECEMCGKRYNQKGALVVHAKIHTPGFSSDSQVWKCSECGKEFKSYSGMWKHKNMRFGNATVQKGDLCGQTYSQSSSPTQHYMVHSGGKPFQCETCGKLLTTKGALVSHMRVHVPVLYPANKAWTCPEYSESSSLRQHGAIHTGENRFQCGTCGKSFTRKSALLFHVKVHMPGLSSLDKEWKCSECGKEFRSYVGLSKHKRTHLGITKTHKCDLCGKMFAEKSALKRHHLIHTGEKAFQCETCGKCFTLKSTLVVHAKTHVPGLSSLGKEWKCSECAKEFRSFVGLSKHKRTHLGIPKIHKCDLCGKMFAEKSGLKRHHLFHTGKKTFKCETCGKCFTLKSTLVVHAKTHVPGLSSLDKEC